MGYVKNISHWTEYIAYLKLKKSHYLEVMGFF